MKTKKKTTGQISMFSSETDMEIITKTFSQIENYIDSVTWMVLHVGPIIYCEYCNSSFCECNKFTPMLIHEQLAICDKFENHNDSIPAMSSAFMFPLGTIFAKKIRYSGNLQFQMVVNNDQGGYYLKSKILDEIQEIVEWEKVCKKLERRIAYQEKLSAAISAVY